MKKILLIFCCLMVFACFSFAQKFSVKSGSVLIYKITSGNSSYTFTITVKKTEPNLEFSYEMSAPANKKGSISISKEAMDTATKLINFFGNEDRKLVDATSIWVSNKIYENACEPGMWPPLSIRFDNAETRSVFGAKIPQFQEYKINGKIIKIRVTEIVESHWDEKLQEPVDDKRLTILFNYRNPLILAMSIGFNVVLMEANNVDVEE